MRDRFFEGQHPDRSRAIRLADALGYQCAQLTARWIEVYVAMRSIADDVEHRTERDDIDDAGRDLLTLIDDHGIPVPIAAVAVSLQFRSHALARHAVVRLLERETKAAVDAVDRVTRTERTRIATTARKVADALQHVEEVGIT